MVLYIRVNKDRCEGSTAERLERFCGAKTIPPTQMEVISFYIMIFLLNKLAYSSG